MALCSDKDFERNVFINCPFSEDFEPLLKPLLFTVLRIGLEPRISFENNTATKFRLDEIVDLMLDSKYSIHDLSLNHSTTTGEEFRMNMPFELGVDYAIALRDYNERCRKKKLLILEDKPFVTKKTISDMAGADFRNHKNEPEELIAEVTTWFSEILHLDIAPSNVWDEYNYFKADNYDRLKKEGFKDKDINRLTIPQTLRAMKDWLMF